MWIYEFTNDKDVVATIVVSERERERQNQNGVVSIRASGANSRTTHILMQIKCYVSISS